MRTRLLATLAVVGATHALLLGGLAGCKDKAPPPPQGTPKVGPEPSASGSGSSAEAKKPAPSGKLQVVAARDGRITIGAFDDGAIYATAGLSLAIARGGGELVRDTKWLSGLPADGFGGGYAMDDVTFGGKFPDDAWSTKTTYYMRGSSNWAVWHWQEGKWATVPNLEGKLLWYYASFGPWKDGTSLALRLNDLPAMGEDEPQMAALSKLLEKSVPRFEVPGKPGNKADSLPTFAAGARPATFSSLASGDVVAVFELGIDEKEVTKVQRWPAGDAKGIVEVPPGVTKTLDRPVLKMASANDVWLGGAVDAKAYLAHFDGKAWTKLDVTMKGDVASIAQATDGTVWIATAPDPDDKGDVGLGELWKRAKGAATFELVPLPTMKFPGDGVDHLALGSASGPPVWDVEKGEKKDGEADWYLAPRQVVVAPDGEPFVAAIAVDDPKNSPANGYPMAAQGRWAVLRIKAPSARLDFPARDMVIVETQDLDDVTIASAVKASKDCSAFFVSAGDVPEGAAANWDPVDLRAAVKDLSGPVGDLDAYEVKMQGKRRVGFYLPLCIDDCAKWVDGFVAALTKKLPAAPKLYCRTPLVTRELAITLPPAK